MALGVLDRSLIGSADRAFRGFNIRDRVLANDTTRTSDSRTRDGTSICTSTSPPLTMSALEDSVRMSNPS
jgi:hypothetical protein